MGISFKVIKEDREMIKRIVDRFIENYRGPVNWEDYRVDLIMSIVACHVNGCPLDLEKLDAAHPNVLVHDVLGIHLHLNHDTGELDDCFYPKTAKKESHE